MSLFKRNKFNNKVTELYNGMQADMRDKVFFGGLKFADEFVTSVSKEIFGDLNDSSIATVFQIYVQSWIRSKGAFNPEFSMPDYIEQALVNKFEMVPAEQVRLCVRASLVIIYNNDPELKTKILMLMQLKKDMASNSESNKAIEDKYINDSDYGLCLEKPVFVAGFGSDKAYLSHLATSMGERLRFNRLGSKEVNGIAGPVDIYQLLTNDNQIYMHIYICNYGTRNTKDVPQGLIFVE